MTRPTQGSLWPADTGRRWGDVEPPSGGVATNYGPQWRAVVRAAEAVGWSPDDVANRGTEALAAVLRAEGLRDWSPATVTRYAKLLRYAGVDPSKHPAPSSAEVSEFDHRVLWVPHHHPASARSALASVVTWHWPSDLHDLLGLDSGQVSSTATGGLRLSIGGGTVEVAGGGAAFEAWMQRRPNSGPPLFVTVRSSRTPLGSPLSVRGFQASFAQHAAANGLRGLTWKHYHKSGREFWARSRQIQSSENVMAPTAVAEASGT